MKREYAPRQAGPKLPKMPVLQASGWGGNAAAEPRRRVASRVSGRRAAAAAADRSGRRVSNDTCARCGAALSLLCAAPIHAPFCAQDFQFFNIGRLTQLYEKDNSHEVHKHSLQQVSVCSTVQHRALQYHGCTHHASHRRLCAAACNKTEALQARRLQSMPCSLSGAALPPAPPPAPPPPQREANMRQQGASEEAVAEELAPKEDDPQPLTEDDIQGEIRTARPCGLYSCAACAHRTPACRPCARPSSDPEVVLLPSRRLLRTEREQLLREGFSNWMRRDFNAFVRACEKYGRHALADIARDIETKTEEEVRGPSLVVCCVGRCSAACPCIAQGRRRRVHTHQLSHPAA